MTSVVAAHGSVTKKPFGTMPDGTPVELYTIKNGTLEVEITTYGARVVSILTPDRNGKVANVVLGYDNLESYLADKTFFGSIVGRYGNRIAFGKFSRFRLMMARMHCMAGRWGSARCRGRRMRLPTAWR
jgi:aldose 1-epimerase